MSINFDIDSLRDDSEMGALMGAYDWESSPLGAREDWPQSLKAAIQLLLGSRHPMLIWWGPDLIQFYNDAFAKILGPERHPSALGKNGRECWAEIWDIIGPQIEYVMSGKGSTWDEDRLVPITRHGSRENARWTYGCSPIDIEDGVGGVLLVCEDATNEHRAQQGLQDRLIHFERHFEQAPGFVAVLRGPDHVFELTNATYRQMVGDREFVGRSVRDVFPELVGQGFFERLDGVYQTGIAYVGRHLPVALAPSGGGSVKNIFVDFVYQPILDPDGSVSGIFVQGTDVTDLYDTGAALRDKDVQLTLALEAAEIGVWECTIKDGGFVDLKEDERSMRLLNRSPNEALTFEAFASRVHPDDRLKLKEASERALDPTGDGIMDVEYRMLARPDMPSRWIHARAKTVISGGVTKFVGTVRDISNVKDAEARQELLRSELQHRIKNLIAMVGAIASQTLRGEDIADRREAFKARLHVLAQAQNRLTSQAIEYAGIHDTIRAALAPHDDAVSRFDIAGPDFILTPKQALSMALALHELATNAMKYGSLSSEVGRVSISWSISTQDGSELLEFAWRETSGPTVFPPASRGFGSRLISRVLAADFNGDVQLDYLAEGLVCKLTAKLDHR